MRKLVCAAGGVVYRKTNDSIQMVLVGAGDPVLWRLPKGIVDEGESLGEAALREVCEESGVIAQVLEELIVVRYEYGYQGDLIDKKVTYYLMKALGEDKDRCDDEYDFIVWVSLQEAVKMLFYPNEKRAVQKALQSLAFQE